MINYAEKFRERGLEPLALIINHKQKVPCIDKEGYKYYLNYHDHIADLRTKEFDKWSKKNPFKANNMRLYATTVQDNVCILSSDEELVNSSVNKIEFICPRCGKSYKKKWCHWIGQPDQKHFCSECSNKLSAENRKYSYEKIKKFYLEKGFELLEDSKNFDCQGGHARLHCKDAEGLEYDISLGSLNNGNSGSNKFSSTNPYAVSNLQKVCDNNNLQLKIISQIAGKNSTRFKVQCRCGKYYTVEANQILSLNRYRCPECSKRESRLELMTREWLEEHDIPFQTQYRFPDCRNKRSLPFDFKCDWHNQIILIEVDGVQHYYVTQWTSKEDLERQKERDKIKEDYAKEHDYILLRIPFWLFNTGTYINKLQETFNLL